MGSIILEIQADAMNEKVSIQSLLRKAYVVTTKLGIEASKQWIQAELNGYEEGDVPKYRQIKGALRGFNPVNGWIPVHIPDDEIDNLLSVFHFRQSIGEVEETLKKFSDGFSINFTGQQLSSIQDVMQCNYQFCLKFSGTSLFPIVDAVRNSVLEWSLKLEQEGILGEGISFSSEEVKKANMSTNINIQNFQGVLGDVKGSELTQKLDMSITQSYDFTELEKYLSSNSVPKEDITDLKLAIDSDGQLETSGQFGSNVSAWIGRMVSKAADGSWTVALGAAGNILATGISKYYGLA
ncbi:hypothetical protein V4V56_003970 [Vibrio mimicus]|uniref:AbiTii domain-containing protein n=1 Tax=Vibrio TaxID=662 RepID=UPI00102A4916|nr:MULTISPECIES: hypothetical protein [Vibrio]RZQ35794.1 hypothetical protein D8T55_23410 [Vibrio vulnificus]HAT8521743.1 hypothetical protein [Vibrio vulnificus]